MNKIKFLFFILVLGLVIIIILNLYSFESPDFTTRDYDYPLIITKISGDNIIFKNLREKKVISIHDFDLPPSGELETDLKTTFEFGYRGFRFQVYPESLFSYQLSTHDFNFKKGILEWNREKEGEKMQVHTGSLQYILTLSEAGKIESTGQEIKICNYRGDLQYRVNEAEYKLNPNKMIRLTKKNEKVSQLNILPATRRIFPGFPKPKVITVDEVLDYSVVLNWKAVIGAKKYKIKLFSGELKEDLLFTDTIEYNSYTMDFLRFEGTKDFYWQVIPVDEVSGIEGVPSPLGIIRFKGELINKEEMPKQSSMLIIKNITVSGNMVLIRGEADKDSTLYINGEIRQINLDGTFFHTITFDSYGKHTLTFKLISPDNKTITLTRKVTLL